MPGRYGLSVRGRQSGMRRDALRTRCRRPGRGRARQAEGHRFEPSTARLNAISGQTKWSMPRFSRLLETPTGNCVFMGVRCGTRLRRSTRAREAGKTTTEYAVLIASLAVLVIVALLFLALNIDN